jgi:acetolactate synthase-1/2/3 large subunit
MIQPAEGLAAPNRRVADQLVDVLVTQGVRTFIGMPGGAISPIYDALLDRSEARLVYSAHESSAAFAAAAFALSGEMACVLVTSGPGLTNALTGIASAFAEGLPILVLVGEVPLSQHGRGALQEGSAFGLDLLTMCRSVTRFTAMITRPDNACALLREALDAARGPVAGPVVLTLPLDVVNQTVRSPRLGRPLRAVLREEEALLEEARARLATARRGAIVIGAGARGGPGADAAFALAERLQWPVATTAKGKGLFPESHPLAVGICGYGGHASAARALGEDVDVLLALGCGFSETGTNGWAPGLAPNAALIQLDVDLGRLGRNRAVELGLVGTLEALAPLLTEGLPQAAPQVYGIERRAAPLPDKNDALHPATALSALQATLPTNTRYACDIGEHLLFTLHHLHVDAADGFYAALGLGSMGSGVGAGLGLKLATPERPVVVICGDWGFRMSGMDLTTCVQERLGVVFVVLNDGVMNMVEAGFRRVYKRPLGGPGPTVDFVRVAESCGAIGLRVNTVADLQALTPALVHGEVPVVIDLRVDPNAAFAQSGRDQTLGTFTGRR